ncbi:hypothetical protein [Brucella pituitosa]|nr:hypothetical protein [Brucella pituitosa]
MAHGRGHDFITHRNYLGAFLNPCLIGVSIEAGNILRDGSGKQLIIL